MKMKIGIAVVILAVMLMSVAMVSAMASPTPRESWQKTRSFFYGTQATLVPYGDPYTHTFQISTSGITWSSCYDPAIYQYGTCSYLYKGYIILPQGCTEVSCSVARDFTPLTSINAVENVVVNYNPTTINKFAVVAFMAKGNMQYANGAWNEVSFEVIESTKQSDTVDVSGAPAPPPFNVGEWLQGVITGISAWFCGSFGWFC